MSSPRLPRLEIQLQLIEPSPSGGGFNADSPGVEPVVVPVSLFQGSVDKEPEMIVVILHHSLLQVRLLFVPDRQI